MILVLNCGSSSIKYRLFDTDLAPLSGGLIEKIGEPGGPASSTPHSTPPFRLRPTPTP